MRAYVTGTSTRKVDDLVKALGCDSGVSKSSVSRICKAIDDDVTVLRQRRRDHQPFPNIWLDATYVHVREAGQVVSKAVVIATGVRADGHREVMVLVTATTGAAAGEPGSAVDTVRSHRRGRGLAAARCGPAEPWADSRLVGPWLSPNPGRKSVHPSRTSVTTSSAMETLRVLQPASTIALTTALPS